MYRCTHLVWFIHKRLPWFFILKSLSLSVLHELLQRHQPIFVLVHLGGEREGGREGRRERGREGRREGGERKREREGGKGGGEGFIVSLYPSPHTYFTLTPTSVRTCSLMRAISSWASIPCMSSPYAFLTCERDIPRLIHTQPQQLLVTFNTTAVTNQILLPMLPHPPLHRRELPAPFGQDGCRCLYL